MEYYYNKKHPGNPKPHTIIDVDSVKASISSKGLKEYVRKLYGGEWFFEREGDVILWDLRKEEGVDNTEELKKLFLPSMLKVELFEFDEPPLFNPKLSIKENALAILGEVSDTLHPSGTMTIQERGGIPGGRALRRAWPFMYPLFHTPTSIYRCLRWRWVGAKGNLDFTQLNHGKRKLGEKKAYLMVKLGHFRDGRGRKQVVWECAHRLVVWALGGGLNDGQVVMHVCDDERCLNPAHLLVGTQEHNTNRDYGEPLESRRDLVEGTNQGEWVWDEEFEWHVTTPP